MIAAHRLAVAALLFSSLALSACTPWVRREASTLSATQVASLRKGVQVMQSRAASDPTSWSYQAAMHGTYTTPTSPNWNQCQHGSYFFFSWHRMYLYFFERILRDASGDSALALPYWNYSSAATAALPDIFRNPADATNPLYVSARNVLVNSGSTLPPSATDYSTAFAYTNFDAPTASPAGFGGQPVAGAIHFDSPHGALESQPHDIVHGLVGGWMNDPNTAAQDPIFYFHHANIDRLWSAWLRQGAGRADPSDTTWLDTAFTFYDVGGTVVTLTGKQVIDTVKQLNYRYDDEPVSPPPVPRQPATRAVVPPGAPVENLIAEVALPQKASLTEAPLELKLSATPKGPTSLKETLAKPQGRIILRIEGIDYDKTPSDFYEIYLNPPDGPLDYKNSSFAASIGFFGLKHHHATDAQKTPFAAYEITKTVRALQREGRWNDQSLTVRFVRRGLVPAKGQKEEVAAGVRATFTRVAVTWE